MSPVGAVRAGAAGARVDVIPDSAIHRWILDDVATETATDSIGDADGTVSGVSSISDANYQGGAAGDGDGSNDDILTGTLGSFGSNSASDWAIAFTVDNFDEAASGSDDFPMGIQSTGASGNIELQLRMSDNSKGDLTIEQRDAGNNASRWTTDSGGHVDGNNLVRVLINKVAVNTDGAVEFYVASSGEASYTQVGSSRELDNGFGDGSLEDFTHDWALFAQNNGGSTGQHTNAVLDDVIIYNSSLGSADRGADLSAQPAFG